MVERSEERAEPKPRKIRKSVTVVADTLAVRGFDSAALRSTTGKDKPARGASVKTSPLAGPA